MNQLMALAFAGLTAGLTGCGGSAAPASSAAQDPSGEKHGCKADADGKHSCSAEMKQEDMKGTPPAESDGAPGSKPAPAPGM